MKTPPNEEDLAAFWRGIYEDDQVHNEKASWIPVLENELGGKPKMKDQSIMDNELQSKLP